LSKEKKEMGLERKKITEIKGEGKEEGGGGSSSDNEMVYS
jgi:hypothetical protein